MPISLTPQQNQAGDPDRAAQGFGRLSPNSALQFDLGTQSQLAAEHFEQWGYVVLGGALGTQEIEALNQFFEDSQRQRPDLWGLGEKRKPHHRNQGLILSQPLLDFPELDQYLQHPGSFPLIASLLGGIEHVRWSEFNFRETPLNAGLGTMNFHHDAVLPDRHLRSPYLPCDYLCSIHYLTPVTDLSPAFCVVPGSHRFESLREAYEALGTDYTEQPIRGQAGTCILYDTALFHTRLDGNGREGRRTWHQYHARGGFLRSSLPTTSRYIRAPSPSLTDWNLIPQRLIEHPDPTLRRYFSHWNSAQGEWVASGYAPDVRAKMPRGES
ncbi:MAG: phytanoyl-CoA dioxygenase family protein [Pseudomonadales bacterium]|nr:phytanoyl-CoA dioxygenase family protein [Pseudomonadales bacterium]